MAQLSYPLNRDEYIDAEIVQLWHYGRTSGVFAADNNLRVSAVSGRTIRVSRGAAWLRYTDFGGVVYANTTDVDFTIDIGESVLNRIDRVVIRFDLITNVIALQIKKGTPAGNPIAPALQRDSNAYEIGLSDIRMNAGVITVSAGQITDQRLNEAVCGLVRDGATGIPTSALNTQWLSWFEQSRTYYLAKFDELAQQIGDIIDIGDAGAILSMISGHINSNVNDTNGVHELRQSGGILQNYSRGKWRDYLGIAQIIVNTTAPATIKCSYGDTVLTNASPSQSMTFSVPNYGVWVIDATFTSGIWIGTESVNVTVDALKQYNIRIAPPLANCDWPQIGAYSATITPSNWKIGDEKNLTLTTNEVLTMQIYGFNHDDLADGTGKARITFGMKHLMATTQQRQPIGSNAFGQTNSLESILAVMIYGTVPSDIRGYIKQVNKITSFGGAQPIMRANNARIFLLSEMEITGTVNGSKLIEGAMYSIFTTGTTNRVKRMGNGTGAESNWWLSSSVSETTGSHVIIQANGNYGTLAADAQAGVCFGFCI